MRTRDRHILMLSLVTGFMVAACAIFTGPGEAPLVPGRTAQFSHAIHAGEEVGLDCIDCHVGAEDAADAGMPAYQLCITCHDEEEDAEKPRDKTPQGFVLPGQEEATWTQATKPSVPLAFSHAVHYEAGAECEQCHAGVAASEQVSRDWHVTMNECIQCHDNLGLPDVGCNACHPGVNQQWAPGSHDTGQWLSVHGSLAGFDTLAATPVANQCQLCHQESQCNSCHQQMRPRNHTESWRQKTHGYAASVDRSRCTTCHKEDSCVRCHTRTIPTSHNAIWGGATSSHCVRCHIPLGAEDRCLVCHKRTTGHRLAPNRPPPPHPGAASDCRSCHMNLTHFDNGQSCNLCHK